MTTPNETTELLPCPFCGWSDGKDHANGCYFSVSDQLRAAAPADLSLVPEVLAAWNRRAALPPTSAELVASGTIPRRVLLDVRHTLQLANDSPGGPISDTIWMMHGPETLFDFIDAALADYPYDPGNTDHLKSAAPAAPVADTGAVKNARTDAEVMRGIMKRYDEFIADKTAQLFGTPFNAWAAAKYPAEYMANRDFLTPASPSPTDDSAADARARRLLKAADTYANNYLRDQLADARDCIDSDTQHAEVCELFAAIASMQPKGE